jgi:flagellar biosynthesis protein FlhG
MLDAYGLIKALKGAAHVGELHLLVNMVSARGETKQTYNSLATVADRYLGLRLNLLGELPRDDGIVQCIKRQEPFLLARPRSVAARTLREMAKPFTSGLELNPRRGQGGFFSRLLNSFR